MCNTGKSRQRTEAGSAKAEIGRNSTEDGRSEIQAQGGTPTDILYNADPEKRTRSIMRRSQPEPRDAARKNGNTELTRVARVIARLNTLVPRMPMN